VMDDIFCLVIRIIHDQKKRRTTNTSEEIRDGCLQSSSSSSLSSLSFAVFIVSRLIRLYHIRKKKYSHLN